jgi:hypothetical protein
MASDFLIGACMALAMIALLTALPGLAVCAALVAAAFWAQDRKQ